MRSTCLRIAAALLLLLLGACGAVVRDPSPEGFDWQEPGPGDDAGRVLLPDSGIPDGGELPPVVPTDGGTGGVHDGGIATVTPHYTNPVTTAGSPDPSIIKVEDDYYLTYTGNSTTAAFPILHSRDLITWKAVASILTKSTLPSWIDRTGSFWAPEIHRVDGQYNAYVTVRSSGRLCIAVARSPYVTGPYTVTGSGPLVSHPYGAIDASYFKDPKTGIPYLLWKVDGNSAGKPTPIMIQRLNTQGTALLGSAVQLMVATLADQHGIVEGPEMFLLGDTYFLMYAGGGYSSSYREYVARASSPLGPFVPSKVPMSSNTSLFQNSGHASAPVPDVTGQLWLFEHAYVVPHVGDGQPRRGVLAPLVMKDGFPIFGPYASPISGSHPGPTIPK